VNNVYAWLGGIVYRQGMRIFNKKKEVITGEEQDYLFEEIESGEATPEQTVEQQATVDIVKGMIDDLPELQRVAIMAFYYDNMKIDEIASMCECSANTIKSRLNYAKKFLKEKVEAHEKQNRYKLCSVSPAILLLAFKGLFAESEYKMSAQAVKSVYMATCDSLGIEAVSAVISSGSTFGSAGAVASGTATTVKAGLGIKLGITAIALLTAGGIMVAVLHNMNSNSSQEPVAVVEQEAESEEQSASETQTEESLYNESIPMEGLYKYGVYTISITNATVEDNRNATFDMELTYTNPETKEVETVLVTSVKKENGIAAIDATSSLGNRWFGSLMFLYDDSIRLNLSKQDTEGSVWDIMWDGSVVILTKAAADEIIQDRMLEEGIYSYTEGTDAAMDGGYILTISNVDANSFVMKLEIISDGGNKVDQLETDNEWVFMNNGIATFTGKTGWNVGMQGYLYANEDGSISLSYTATDGADEVPWYGAYPDGCLKPITLQKK
ncbi:MAG: sigma-70 family RNA polymerase sigma factor, partial [Lachnospiraceae bacterium]|nr:sigma-70 family RNA polymerase sigma factor [Lachnospiraceae bacterium]